VNPQDRTRAILRSTLDAECRLVAVAIADHMDAHDTTFVSVPTLALETALSERTVQQVMAYGIETGWLTREGRPGCSLTLRLVWDRLNDAGRTARGEGKRKAKASGSDRNPRTGRTGEAGAPVHGAQSTPARGAPVPPHGAHPTPARGAPEATTQATTEATMKPPAPMTPPPTVVVPDPDDGLGGLDPNQDEPDLQAHRPHRSTGNLSTYQGPRVTSPTSTRIAGRDVPDTWPGILGPSVLRALPQEAAAISALCTKLRTLGLTPAEVLATPADEWRFITGIGGPRGQHVRLAELCRRAGWEPGCLAVAKEEPAPAAPARKRRRRTEEVIDEEGLTPAQQKDWARNGFERDENDKPVLLLRAMGAS
jgi:hypothetical protein